jgi:hypothetical protein
MLAKVTPECPIDDGVRMVAPLAEIHQRRRTLCAWHILQPAQRLFELFGKAFTPFIALPDAKLYLFALRCSRQLVPDVSLQSPLQCALSFEYATQVLELFGLREAADTVAIVVASNSSTLEKR